MTLRSRLKQLEDKENVYTGQRPWDIVTMTDGYACLGAWLIENDLLLEEAVAHGAQGPRNLPFTLREALEVEKAAARPPEPGFDPCALAPWQNPTDYRQCHIEIVRCAGYVHGFEAKVLERRRHPVYRERSCRAKTTPRSTAAAIRATATAAGDHWKSRTGPSGSESN